MAQSRLGALSAEDTAAIRAASDQFSRLLLARDFDALVRLYTDDGAFMPPHQPAVLGRAALRSWMAAFPTVTQFAFAIDDIDGREDLAYVRGRYSMTLAPDGAPAPVDDVGKFIEIRKKQPDGSWLLAADIFNSDKV
jgi:ketosteroid isomerase-like protein